MAQDRRIVYINPRDLLPSKDNVRSDPGDLAGLAETIREHGILQPLGVMREGDAYRIIYGNRRRDAAIVVGLDRVPCLVLEDVDPAGCGSAAGAGEPAAPGPERPGQEPRL